MTPKSNPEQARDLGITVVLAGFCTGTTLEQIGKFYPASFEKFVGLSHGNLPKFCTPHTLPKLMMIEDSGEAKNLTSAQKIELENFKMNMISGGWSITFSQCPLVRDFSGSNRPRF